MDSRNQYLVDFIKICQATFKFNLVRKVLMATLHEDIPAILRASREKLAKYLSRSAKRGIAGESTQRHTAVMFEFTDFSTSKNRHRCSQNYTETSFYQTTQIHYSSRLFHVTAASAALAAIPICHECYSLFSYVRRHTLYLTTRCSFHVELLLGLVSDARQREVIYNIN